MAPKTEGKLLVFFQVNCRSICNKTLDLWNLIDTYNPDVLIGTESWLSEEISNAEIFRADYTTSRRDKHTRSGGFFICVKNYFTCAELWVDEVYEMTAVEVKGRDPKITWEIVGIYRVPKRTCSCLKNWHNGPDVWEELRSVTSLKVVSTCLMRIGMVMQKSVRRPNYFKIKWHGETVTLR